MASPSSSANRAGSAAPAYPPALHDRLAAAKLLVLDVDGTLTDGHVWTAAEGEALRFSIQDGFALKQLARENIAVAWISGRASPAARARGQDLGILELHLGVADKTRVLSEVQARLGIEIEHTVAIGDDLPDLRLARRASVFVAPANARSEVKAHAHWVLLAKGGDGAVRELSEALLQARQRWAAIVDDHAR